MEDGEEKTPPMEGVRKVAFADVPDEPPVTTTAMGRKRGISAAAPSTVAGEDVSVALQAIQHKYMGSETREGMYRNLEGRWVPRREIAPDSRWRRVRRAMGAVAQMSSGQRDEDGLEIESKDEWETANRERGNDRGYVPTPAAFSNTETARERTLMNTNRSAGRSFWQRRTRSNGDDAPRNDLGGNGRVATEDGDGDGEDDDDLEDDVSRRVRGVKPWWILLPSHPFRSFWEPFMVIPLLYVATIVPYFVLFSRPMVGGWAGLDLFIYSCFVADILVNLCSAYEEEENGDIVVSPRLIAWRYARGWLLIDLIAVLPFDFFIPSSEASSLNELVRVARLPRALRLLRLLRLVRLMRVPQLQQHMRRVESTTSLHPATGRVLATVFWALMFLHWYAGIWFFTGTLVSEAGRESWIDHFHVDSLTADQQYVTSFYWSVTTLTSVGYGDIHPVDEVEMLVAAFAMFSGLTWGGIIVGTVANIQAEIDRKDSDLKQKLRQLEWFIRDAKLPKKLRMRLHAQFDRAMQTDAGRASSYNTKTILDMLSPALRKEIVLFTNAILIRSIPILHSEPSSVQAAVLENVRKEVAARGDFITVEGSYAKHMFFLVRGKAAIYQDGIRIATVTDGGAFGLIECLFSSVRLFSVIALTDCELYSIRREDLAKISGEFVDFGARLKSRALMRLRRFRRKLGRDLVDPSFLEEMHRLGIGIAAGIDASMFRLFPDDPSLRSPSTPTTTTTTTKNPFEIPTPKPDNGAGTTSVSSTENSERKGSIQSAEAEFNVEDRRIPTIDEEEPVTVDNYISDDEINTDEEQEQEQPQHESSRDDLIQRAHIAAVALGEVDPDSPHRRPRRPTNETS